MNSLWFVDLNAGRSERLAALSPIVTAPAAYDLARALRDGRTDVANQDGFELTATVTVSALVCSLHLGAGAPLATIGVAKSADDGERLWGALQNAALGSTPSLAAERPDAPFFVLHTKAGHDFDAGPSMSWLERYGLEITCAWVGQRLPRTC